LCFRLSLFHHMLDIARLLLIEQSLITILGWKNLTINEQSLYFCRIRNKRENLLGKTKNLQQDPGEKKQR